MTYRLPLKRPRLPLLLRRRRKPSPRRLLPLPPSPSSLTPPPRARRRTCQSPWLPLTTPRLSRLHGTTGGRRRASLSPSWPPMDKSSPKVSSSLLPLHQTLLDPFILDTPLPFLSRTVSLAGVYHYFLSLSTCQLRRFLFYLLIFTQLTLF